MRRFLRFLRWRLWPRRSDGPLLTAMIARDDGGWTTWWPDVVFEPGGAFQTLDWLVQATNDLLHESGGAFQTLDELVKAIDALVRGRDPSGDGTLQYKIYPWGRPGVGDKRDPFDVFYLTAPGTHTGEPIPETRPHTTFNVVGSPGDLHAREIRWDMDVYGRTTDDLVNRVAEVRGERPDAFVWIRAIRTLKQL
jgi:hypothetical protein